MSNRLKNFIYNNRKSFDDETPSDAVWNRVEQSLPAVEKEKQFTIRDIYKWSAAAAVFFIAATSFYFLVVRKNANDGLAVKAGNEVSTIIPSEYDKQVTNIYKAILQQQQELKSLTSDQPQLYLQFSKDLSALDSSYRVLKTQAVETPNREIIIKAMIQNLHLQAELLSKQLFILNEFKTIKQAKNEKANDPRS